MTATATARRSADNPCVPCLLLGNPGMLEVPDEVAFLGRMLELEHSLPDGRFLRHEWTPKTAPALLWDASARALYSFPALRVQGRVPIGRERMGAAAEAFRQWTGKEPKRTQRAKAPRVHLRRAGAGRHIVYRSNKWGATPRHWQNYLHPFGPGVEVELAPGTPPAAFLVSGGELRLTPRGLEG